MDFFLEVDAESAIGADYFIGTDAGVGGDVAVGIGDADVGGIVADCEMGTVDGGCREFL